MFDLNTRILVVDNMLTMRKLILKSLREIGFTDLSEAGDGTEGWTAISEASPPFGLIFSDWTMPNSTGIDLLKRVRHDSRYGKTPFIFITAESDESHIIEAARAGVSQYLVRPFTTEILRERIENAHKKSSR